MSLTYLGSRSLGQCLPTALEATALATAAVNVTLPSLQARLALALKAQAQLTISPPAFAATVAAAAQLVILLQAQGALPSVSLSLSVVASLIAALEASIGDLEAMAAIAAGITLQLGTVGIHGYAYTGRADTFGPELAAATVTGFPGGLAGDSSGGLVLVATAPEARLALGAFCGIAIS